MTFLDIAQYRRIRLELRDLESELASPGAAGIRRPLDVDRMILDWVSAAPSIGADERTVIEDVVRVLLVRDHLEDFISRSTPDTRSYLESLVQAGDSAYKEATVDDAMGLAAFVGGEADGWWWRRIPKAPGYEVRRAIDRARK